MAREVAEPTVQAFANLYRGRTDVWGSVDGLCNKEAVTPEHYRRHLQGDRSLGVYPLLDNGTCWFFALDLDEKNWQKALDLKTAFADVGLPIYIAQSKSKGYHLYGFAEEKTPFMAAEVREVARRLENKIGIKTEIFPKQDRLDEKLPYGNYINIPCCGFGVRKFLTKDNQPIEVEEAVTRIIRISNDAVRKALALVPDLAPLPGVQPPPPRKKREHKTPHPPCINKILLGVGAGARDNAAFALARHLFDRELSELEIVGILKEWDAKNNPPLGDDRQLEAKVKSAAKGYAFGCRSILEDANLASFCVGKENCEWLEKDTKEKKKKGLIQYRAKFPGLVDLVKEPAPEDPPPEYVPVIKFAYIQDGNLRCDKEYQAGPLCFIPPEHVHLPYLLAEDVHVLDFYLNDYDQGLFNDLLAYFKAAVELPTVNHYDLIVWWTMLTYLYERFDYNPMLLLIGAPERGKSKLGRAITNVSYRGIQTETLNEASIFRWSQDHGATVFFDVMDLDKRAENSDSIDVLLCRFEKGGKVSRVLYPDKGPFLDTVYYEMYGPTVIASNMTVQHILETRCIEIAMPLTKKREWPNPRPETYQTFRERLVAFRARHLYSKLPDYNKQFNGRFGDITAPLGSIMRLVTPEREEILKKVLRYMLDERLSNKAQGVEARVLMAVIKAIDTIDPGILMNPGRSMNPEVSVVTITDRFNEGLGQKQQKTTDYIGRKLTSLGFRTITKDRSGRCRIIDLGLLQQLREEQGLDATPVVEEPELVELEPADNNDLKI